MKKRALRSPFLIVNPKAYIYGQESLDLALVCERLTQEFDIDIVFTAQHADLRMIAEKTKNHQPRTIRVPLNEKAKAILEKYSNLETRILPKICQNVYNRYIRKILQICEITRMVTVIDNDTREPVQKRICDIATTHTARKTFIGNLYKKVKDPNLVASLSGHTDGSRAFARYREIDNEMKRDLVKLID